MFKLSELQEKLRSLGVSPKKALGQNFLINETTVDRIISKVESLKPTAIVEVGPGLGALTERLLKSHPSITLIELDSIFAKYWSDRGLRVIEEDALRVDWTQLGFNPEGACIVSNLPYQISASLVIDRSMDALQFKSMILMFQKEVAQRISASIRTEHYGLLSVIAQTFWDIETVINAGPKDFFPPPQVGSRVLCFRRLESVPSFRKLFLKVVKGAFAQRRKYLTKGLSGYFEKELVEEVLGDCEISPQARAEELKPSEYVRLAEKLNDLLATR